MVLSTQKGITLKEAKEIAFSNCWSSLKMDYKSFCEFGPVDQDLISDYNKVQFFLKIKKALDNRTFFDKLFSRPLRLELY